MKRGWAMFAAGLLVASTAHADDTAAAGSPTDTELAQSYVLIARDAAAAGSCDLVWDLGAQVRALDPALHARVFVPDPLIEPCLRGRTRPPAPPPRGIPRLGAPDHHASPAGPSSVRPRSAPAGAIRVERTGTPPLSASRLLGEILVGGVAGAGGLALAVEIGEPLLPCGGENRECGDQSRPNVLIAAYVTFSIAVPLGVYAVGQIKDQDGSLIATVAGSLLGSALGVAALFATDFDVGLGLLFASPPLGAVVGFNLTRRWDPVPRTALLSVRGGDLALGLPLVTRGTGASGAPVTMLTLLGGSF